MRWKYDRKMPARLRVGFGKQGRFSDNQKEEVEICSLGAQD